MTYKKISGNSTSASLNSSSVDELGDVNTTGATSGEVLKYNGSEWVAGTDNASGNVETFTLSATNISNKYIDLAAVPSTLNDTILTVSGAPGLSYGTDFEMISNGSDFRRLSWNGKTLDGILEENDELTVEYN